MVCDAYGIKIQNQFSNTLADKVRKRGSMDALISDRGSYEVSRKVTDFLRSLLIADYQSEPCHQHQNKDRQCYGTAKCWTNTVGDQHPIGGWASNMCGSCSTSHLLSHLEVFAHPSLTWPDSDIFFFLHFQFDEPVYNKVDKNEQDHAFLLHLMRRKGIGLVC